MTSDLVLPIAEQVVPGRRLGRHIRHDPRSLRYLVQATGVAKTKVWDRRTPILDQGDIGSCTGNATAGVLGTSGLYEHLSTAQQQALDEAQALRFYALATQLDDAPGTYPPTDTGSDGLSVAKAATQLGWINGYKHITSVPAAQTAILETPFIVGTSWLSGMDEPDSTGLVHATGTVRGGHEYECYGYDAARDRWMFCNSWGPSWGDAGRFALSGADFTKLLRAQGDATVFVPLSQPAPTPTPAPAPARAFPTAEWAAFKADVDAFLGAQL